MKKLILGAVMMMGFTSFSTAQKIGDTATKKTVEKKVAAKPSGQGKKTVATHTVATKQVAKPTAAASAKPATAHAVVSKKDGASDKHFKNAADTGKGPLQKDGTPEKGHKSKKR